MSETEEAQQAILAEFDALDVHVVEVEITYRVRVKTVTLASSYAESNKLGLEGAQFEFQHTNHDSEARKEVGALVCSDRIITKHEELPEGWGDKSLIPWGPKEGYFSGWEFNADWLLTGQERERLIESFEEDLDE